MQKLQAWPALAATAQQGLELHRADGNRTGNQTRLSQDYGFLARALLEQQQWEPARAAAQQALVELAEEPADRNWLRGLYRLFWAQAERGLGNGEAAIAQLTAANAREVSDLGYPKPAIGILVLLRELYLEQRQYRLAFEAKRSRLSIEQQYGIRAFVGAGRLQARRQAVVTEFQVPTVGMVAPEIAAAGRQQDLQRLVERVERRDNRLNVIHGGSGVGKSSLVNAGLVPMLRQMSMAAKDNLPVVIRTYTQWVPESCTVHWVRRLAEFHLFSRLERRTGQPNQREFGASEEASLRAELAEVISQGLFDAPTTERVLEQLRLHDAGNRPCHSHF